MYWNNILHIYIHLIKNACPNQKTIELLRKKIMQICFFHFQKPQPIYITTQLLS